MAELGGESSNSKSSQGEQPPAALARSDAPDGAEHYEKLVARGGVSPNRSTPPPSASRTPPPQAGEDTLLATPITPSEGLERRPPGEGADIAPDRTQVREDWKLVEPRGIEPLTSSLRTTRSPN